MVSTMISRKASLKGVLLAMLLITNMFLTRKGVGSSPICPNGSENCQVSLGDLFDRAVKLSHYIHSLSAEMFNEFDEHYAQGRGFIAKAINSCHTSSLTTPEGKEQAQQIHHGDLLDLVLSVLRSWNDPLLHLVSEVQRIQEAPDTILWKAMEIEEQNKKLLEGMEKIVGRVHPGAPSNEVFSAWSELPSLQLADEDSRLFAFYNLLHCLRRDSHKIDNYLKLLKCRLIHDDHVGRLTKHVLQAMMRGGAVIQENYLLKGAFGALKYETASATVRIVNKHEHKKQFAQQRGNQYSEWNKLEDASNAIVEWCVLSSNRTIRYVCNKN